MKAIGYLRVSTDRQAEKGLGIPEQEAALRAWAKAGGHRLVALYRDEGESGSNGLDTREGLADALGALRDGKAEALVVARLDRLARDLVLQEQLLAEVRRLGAVLCSAAGGEDAYLVDDATDPSRRLIRQILGAVAEYDRSMIRLRLLAGRRRKAAGGGYAGGEPPMGKRAENRELVDDPAELAAVERIAELRAEGSSLRAIARALEAEGHRPRRGERWHPTVLARIVRRQEGGEAA